MEQFLESGAFPSWTTMVVADICMVALAWATTYLAVLRWPLLSRAGAQLGVTLIVGGFWIIAALHIYHGLTVALLPHWLGEAAAHESMRRIHDLYSWYVYPAAGALIVGGLAHTSRRLEELDALLQAAKAEAEAQSAQKSTFLASMSHELRTPLNAILGYSEFMQLDPISGGNARLKEYASNIQSSGRMLHDLISDLLDLSRIEQGRIDLRLERIDLGAVVKECIEQVETMSRAHGAGISLHVADGLDAFYIDRRAIEQVTLNLVTNAVKHTPSEGTITVTVDRSAWGEARLVVADSGSGIPPRILDHIFDPYVCGDPFTNGGIRSYGLGLSICKRLIDAHGGSIAIASELGSGTVVTVTLPYTPDREPEARSAA